MVSGVIAAHGTARDCRAKLRGRGSDSGFKLEFQKVGIERFDSFLRHEFGAQNVRNSSLFRAIAIALSTQTVLSHMLPSGG